MLTWSPGRLCWLLSCLVMLLPARGLAQRGESLVRLTVQEEAKNEGLVNLAGIVDATTDSHGHAYILRASSRITVLDSRLRLVSETGQDAGGSMPFRDPVSIGVLRDGRVAVLDRARQSVIMFTMRAPGSLIVSDTVPLGVASEGMCVLPGDHFLIYGATRGMRLHIFDGRGRLLRSFAPADSALSAPAQDQLAMGRIGCDAAGDNVLITSAFLPLVESFDIRTGNRVWADSLRPYRSVTITVRPRGMSIRSGPGGHSVVATAMVLGTCRLLQTVFLGRQDGATSDTIVTFVYGESGGLAETPRLDVPRLHSIGAGLALSLDRSLGLVRRHGVAVAGCAARRARANRS